jgi:hypothetical protein
MKKLTFSLLSALSLLFSATAGAGVPLNGLQGDGGIAFNPVAFPAGTYAEDGQPVSAPQVGAWYVRLGSADIDWAAASAAFSVAKRLELSYGYGWIDANRYGDDSVSTHNLGAKLAVLPDGAFGQAWLPAVSVGGIYKHTDAATAGALGLGKDGADFYAVASKLVGAAPVPVLLSGGVALSDEVVEGVVGHGDYGFGWFANLDLIPVPWLAVGGEWKSGIDADKVRNHDYYDLHAAWFATKSLTLVAAYVDTGSKSGSRLGVGDGFVLSAQYQF